MTEDPTFAEDFRPAARGRTIAQRSPSVHENHSMTLGLYIHVPFCSQICHYCDFAKTANYSRLHVESYFRVLETQLQSWIQKLNPEAVLTSVFFGGGTPGLFCEEYSPLFDILKAKLAKEAETSIEANPRNVTESCLRTWSDLGVNRLSIGVQTFDQHGLKTMTRDHSSEEAVRSLELALQIMPTVNGDLIYGWPGQTEESWTFDLDRMIHLGVPHLSLYALTYEGRTPFAIAERRGKMQATDDDQLAAYYDRACQLLKDAGYEHEEVSNWSKPGHSCRHNWLYWRAEPFVGIGAGAHGYLLDPSRSAWGERYSYPGDIRKYLRECGPAENGVIADSGRDKNSWLTEYVGCALRCKAGLDLKKVEAMGFQFSPDARIMKIMEQAEVAVVDHKIILSEQEWFRETAWSSLLLSAMIDSNT